MLDALGQVDLLFGREQRVSTSGAQEQVKRVLSQGTGGIRTCPPCGGTALVGARGPAPDLPAWGSGTAVTVLATCARARGCFGVLAPRRGGFASLGFKLFRSFSVDLMGLLRK